MKLVVSKISLISLFKLNKSFYFIIDAFLNIIFFSVRSISKLLAYDDGPLVIISLHRLGDTIFTIPTIREIQKNFKEKITIICFPESVPIYKLALNNINYFELKYSELVFNHRIVKSRTKKKLRRIKPGIIIDLIGGMSSASILFNLRAREITGTSKRIFRSLYDNFVELREKPQLMDIYFDAISPLVDLQNRIELKKYSYSINPNGKIIIHPFAAWREKLWNFKKFFELALRLQKDFEVKIISPPGKISIDSINEFLFAGCHIIEANSVDELINQIKECSLLIGNDSGPVNIANFLGKPTFTIFGATNPDYTITSEKHQLYIQKKLTCSAQSNEKYCLVGGAEFVCPGMQCMDFLSVDEVYTQIMVLTEKYCTTK